VGALIMLRFGYTRGLPEGTETAWGCRAVVTDDGTVHVVQDRISAVGPQIDRLVEHLDRLPFHRSWRSRAGELRRAGVMDTRVDEEFALYADDVVVIKGNTQASAGYLYVCAYFRPTPDQVAKHPVAHRGCEVFRFLTRGWCITQALELIKTDPTAAEFIEAVDVTGLDGYVDLTPPEPGMMRLFVVNVDKEYALTQTDLDVPLVVVRIISKGENLGCLVIDGWHRVYRARLEGRTSLSAYLLSAEAERRVQIALH
jgi:hypothetical protein